MNRNIIACTDVMDYLATLPDESVHDVAGV